MSTITFRPVPASNRPETAPVLPTEIVVAESHVVAGYDDCHVTYLTLAQACAEHQMSAAELLGADLTDTVVQAVRQVALLRGDNVTAGHCEAALDGEVYGREKVADAVVTARLMRLE